MKEKVIGNQILILMGLKYMSVHLQIEGVTTLLYDYSLIQIPLLL